MLPLPLRDWTCTSREENYFDEVVLIFRDAFQIRIIEFVHDVALVEKLQGFVQLVGALFDEGLDIEFELVIAITAFDQGETLCVPLLR